ncbi:hypothetical protein L914_00412 [Phytophthora nicotianae]|uniref:Uncharacterized protein n=1 Tax=Phytophthora nicotianae TaxID=4792 RepID=W2P750_PHYNI|nr:hypothetical protein L914_00412 [Phytophthora nicotianae]
MVSISPTADDVVFAQPSVRTIVRIIKAFCRWLRHVAGRLPGEYTVAKLDAFDRFRRETSMFQIVALLILTPIPCILTNILVESIPLKNPADGSQDCLTFLLRNFLSATIVTMTPFRIKPDCISNLTIQSWKLSLGFGIILGAISTGFIAALVFLSKVFPVPLSQFSPILPMGIVGRIIESRLLHKPEVKPRLETIDQWLAMVVAPILVYPIFTAVFMALAPSHQLWFSLMLPVIKHLIRYALWLGAKNDLDLVGSVTCTIGHFYHVLFTAMCLQNAKNMETLVAVVVVNFIHMIFNCREILEDANRYNEIKSRLALSSSDIVASALAIAQNDRVSRSLHRKSPSRLVSLYPRYQTVEFLTKYHDVITHISTKTTSRQTLAPLSQSSAQVLPETNASLRGDSRREEDFVRSVTSTLHQTEYILLRSYITIFGPSFYGIYLTLVFWLPNYRYFATMKYMVTFDAVATKVFHLMVLCSVELLFSTVYLVIIGRKVGISGIYQLGFVLWSQRVLIQGKFVMLSIMILGFPLEHYGNGFIFRLHSGH